jgi:hypothetical protein
MKSSKEASSARQTGKAYLLLALDWGKKEIIE